MNLPSKKELKGMPTLLSGHTDNLKIENSNTRVWLSRMTVKEGAAWNDMVTVEMLIDGGWKTVREL